MSLPEPKIGQIWSFVHRDGTISMYRLINPTIVGVLGNLCWIGICFSSAISAMVGSDSLLFSANLDQYYYVGDHDLEIVPNYKPEPAVGQLWSSNGGSKVKLIKYDTELKVFETDIMMNFVSSYLNKICTFIGWYDTSLLVPKEVVDLKRYPLKCPRCKHPAYIGFNMIDCSKGCRK